MKLIFTTVAIVGITVIMTLIEKNYPIFPSIGVGVALGYIAGNYNRKKR